MKMTIVTRSMILLGALVALTFSGCAEGIDDFIGQGRKAAKMQNYEEALKLFNKALDIEPGNYNALWGVADVHQREGNLVKQAEMLQTQSRSGLTHRHSGIYGNSINVGLMSFRGEYISAGTSIWLRESIFLCCCLLYEEC